MVSAKVGSHILLFKLAHQLIPVPNTPDHKIMYVGHLQTFVYFVPTERTIVKVLAQHGQSKTDHDIVTIMRRTE
jgi:hypothetical protein